MVSGAEQLGGARKELYSAVHNFLKPAKVRVVIASVFLRRETLALILPMIDPRVKISIFSRWMPADVRHGSSDIGALHTALGYGAEFKIYKDMETNFYIADDKALAGFNARTPGDMREISVHAPEVRDALAALREHALPPEKFTDKPEEALTNVLSILQSHGITPCASALKIQNESQHEQER